MSSPEAKRASYDTLIAQTQALLQGERDRLANLAQFAALIYHSVPQLNWSGFYLVNPKNGQELVLGPFQGKVACVRIAFSRGVCGACARTREVQLVEDVHAFPGHIACDAASRSELVLPIVVDGQLRAVFDLDSPEPARFDAEDARGFQAALQILIDGTDWS
ncbi:GAF domain-containing protein [Roseateles amylovorans]|uniref:GAF domain-containing protein n=1 Tax=Roseateles amylovorans TaxID=2978473 RepID=A0ABY6B7N7_9BURK|nr:GAF domain-containing protein [Roseateles amylovorans]UXH80854.1 GAF domain-containing protein [Roseateles amylovorans]